MSLRQQYVVFYIIITAQFCGTSLWFAGNAVLPELQQLFHWPATSLGFITSATQLGFIAGTLVFAVLGLTDRYSPSKIFFVSSLIAGTCNLFALADLSSYPLVLVSRGLTGFFLAGIYPVGMKIAADWNEKGLGHWLGALVGALILGTSFPHALKIFPQFVATRSLLTVISLIAIFGALLLLLLVPDGPYQKKGSAFSFKNVRNIFKIPSFRSPAFGYFGHMWELYAWWAFVPWIIIQYDQLQPLNVNAAFLSAVIIGSGALGCIAGGYLSYRIDSGRIALFALICSGLCCLISPFMWNFPFPLFLGYMIFWGITIAADSPQFSALVSKNAPDQIRGSAITLVVCIGFSITVVSIQALNALQDLVLKEYLFLLLVPGPLFGILAMILRKNRQTTQNTQRTEETLKAR